MKQVNLVFSGSGTRLIAHVGAVAALEEAEITIRNVVGTSGGAVVAALVAAGYTGAELRGIIGALNWRKFEDRQFAIWNGLCKGDYAYWTIRKLLDRKHVRNFEELNGRLQVVASDISHGSVVLLGQERKMEVAQAVRYSMSIPLFYRPLTYNGALMDDGGLFCNLGINFIADDPLVPTLAVRIFDADTTPPIPLYRGWNPIKQFISLQKIRIDALLKSQAQRHIHDEDWTDRTIQIDGCGISGINFGLTDADKRTLYLSGYNAAKHFLDTHPDFFH